MLHIVCVSGVWPSLLYYMLQGRRGYPFIDAIRRQLYYMLQGRTGYPFIDAIMRQLYDILQGCTGYPFIDAIMRQLATEGWIHHLARHAVACFLTRGDLWISWEKGMQVCLYSCHHF